MGRLPYLEILISKGHLSREQKREVESFASARGLSERDSVVQMKLVDHATAAEALAEHLGFSFIEPENVLPEDQALDLVPRSLVKKHTFLPLFIDDDTLLIACVDQPEPSLEDELRLRYGVPARAVLATPRSINQAIAQHYAPGMRDEAVIQAVEQPTKKSTKKSKAAVEKESPKKVEKRSSGDDQERRKNIGTIMISASIFIPMLPKLLSVFVPRIKMIMLDFPVLGWLPWVVVMITGPITWWFVTQKYWK